jgi:CheY-like chemotaxis protein
MRPRELKTMVNLTRAWRTASALRAKSALEPADQPTPSAPSTPSPTWMGASGRVLLVGQDRRFRAVASALLTGRDYSVVVGDYREDVTELASREGADVVVIDATASLTVLARDVARLRTLRPRVGVVLVSGDPRERIAALPVIAKWSSFDVLFEAIERARPNRG